MHSPIRWIGGKGQWADHIVRLLPPHQTYVEPFGGGASVLFAKPPSLVEVYNDIDSRLVNFFRVLRDPEQFARLHDLVACTPYSREEFYDARDTHDDTDDPVERARRWMVITRQSFGGVLDSWGMSLGATQGGMASTTAAWLRTIDRLPAIHARLMRVQIEHESWQRILELYDSSTTLFYLDPPYVPDTRSKGGYAHELTLADHEALVGRLLASQGKFLLSGYPHPVYKPLEDAGWQVVNRRRHVSIGGGSKSSHEARANGAFERTDVLWVSPTAVVQPQLWADRGYGP